MTREQPTGPDGRPMVGANQRRVWDDTEQRARCTADSKQKLRDGAERGSPDARCGRYPSPGAATCPSHGSKSPQAQRTAKLRLLEMVDPAIVQLGRIMVSATKDTDRLRAVENVLDRTGHVRGLEVTQADAKELLARLLQRRDQTSDEE